MNKFLVPFHRPAAHAAHAAHTLNEKLDGIAANVRQLLAHQEKEAVSVAAPPKAVSAPAETQAVSGAGVASVPAGTHRQDARTTTTPATDGAPPFTGPDAAAGNEPGSGTGVAPVLTEPHRQAARATTTETTDAGPPVGSGKAQGVFQGGNSPDERSRFEPLIGGGEGPPRPRDPGTSRPRPGVHGSPLPGVPDLRPELAALRAALSGQHQAALWALQQVTGLCRSQQQQIERLQRELDTLTSRVNQIPPR